MGAGGPYAIISKALGLEVGGSIGVPLYLSRPLGIAMSVFGFREGWLWLYPDHEPIRWDLKDPQRQTLWGAPAPRSWFEHGTAFAGVATSEATLKATPIIAP